MKSKIKDFLELSKLKIMIPVSLTGFTGFFIYDPYISFRLIMLTFGVMFLAISASVLNQLQEVKIDRKMERTHNRPLPSGRITPKQAFLYFIFNLIAGSILVYSEGNLSALIIGLITIFWYNVIYTYAKRVTAFAVLPGALTGALPPIIGWVAAGGNVSDKTIIFIGFLFFAGQIPHFWLLLLKYGNEYENAGLPSLTKIMSRIQISRLTFSWLLLTVCAALFLNYFDIIENQYLTWALVVSSVILVWQFAGLIKIGERNNYKKYTILLNSYFLMILALLITESIIN